MVFSFERPRARVSDSFYRPECRFIEKGFRKTYREATPLKEVCSYERVSNSFDSQKLVSIKTKYLDLSILVLISQEHLQQL